MFDLIILGGGPAGYLAAERAGAAGLETLLIEKNKLGGVCLNEGCIPSKTLLNSAKILDYAMHGAPYGVTTSGAAIDQAAVVARKNKVVRNLVAGIRGQLKASRVTFKEGLGRIEGRRDGVIQVAVGDEVFAGRRLLIATGSEAVVPPIPGVREGIERGTVLTNREILDLQTIPPALVVVGGGVIGLEMACYFQTCGSTVTVIEMLDHIAGNADREMSSLLQKIFSKKGITFHLGCQVTAIGDGSVSFRDQKEERRVEATHTLLSVGRRPVTQGFGLENIGVLVERGRIVTDRQGLTNVPGVYAAGDVNGIWMLAHTAYREAEVVVNTILGRKDQMRYQAMPSVLYTSPEMAFVGESEESCRDKGLNVRKVVLPMNYSGRYMAENEGGTGQIKLLIDQDRERIVGCHLIGSYASEIILAATFLIETEMTIREIKELVFPHPTVGEIIREAVFHA
jgi:dihydrolipoamide dehydrogenase